jgi:hypothetical protein
MGILEMEIVRAPLVTGSEIESRGYFQDKAAAPARLDGAIEDVRGISTELCAGKHKISAWMRLQVIIGSGGVGERLKPAVLKTVRLERVSGVRIPPPPPFVDKR